MYSLRVFAILIQPSLSCPHTFCSRTMRYLFCHKNVQNKNLLLSSSQYHLQFAACLVNGISYSYPQPTYAAPPSLRCGLRHAFCPLRSCGICTHFHGSYLTTKKWCKNLLSPQHLKIWQKKVPGRSFRDLYFCQTFKSCFPLAVAPLQTTPLSYVA